MKTLWVATTVSSLGSWLLVIAVPAEVFRLTGSPVATGVGLAIEALPALLVGPWAGVAVDRHDRRRTMIVADLCAAVGVALLFLCTGRSRVPLVYVGLLVENVAVAFHRPAAGAAMPALVGTGPRLATTNAMTAFSSATLRLAGPPLGTLLLSWGGLPLVVGVDLASYLASALLSTRLPALPGGGGSAGSAPSGGGGSARSELPGGGPGRSGLRDGLRVLVSSSLLRVMLVSSWLFWTANAALTALLVPFVVVRLHGAPQDLGYLIGALGAGYVVGSLASRAVLRRFATRTALACCYGAVGVCFLALFHAPSLGSALVLVALAGVPGAVAAVVTQHALQARTPEDMIGRVAAAFLASDAAAAVLGALVGPLLAGAVGLGGALDAFSGLVLAAACAAGRPARRARPR